MKQHVTTESWREFSLARRRDRIKENHGPARESNGAPSVEQQPRYLAEASRRVQEQGFYAKKACGARDLPGALRHSSDMLRELRGRRYSPRGTTTSFYMKVCDELRHLDQFFQQLVADGTPAADIYERAQACGDVLPRLYLLITAGAVYVKTHASAG